MPLPGFICAFANPVAAVDGSHDAVWAKAEGLLHAAVLIDDADLFGLPLSYLGYIFLESLIVAA